MNIGKRIKIMREKEKMSQMELAKRLNITRPAVSQIENGERRVCDEELARLSEIFQVSADYILGLEKEPEVNLEEPSAPYAAKQNIRISVPSLKKNKFTEVLLYLLEKTAGKPNIGETVIYKLLYLADYNYYELYEEQMTGATYKKQKYGPVPVEFSKIIESMEKEHKIKVIKDKYYNYTQKRYIPLQKADLSKLKASEKDILDKVIEQYSDWSAQRLSEYSHEDMPWKATKDKNIIDYELVFYRTTPYSVRNYAEDENNGI
jgi:transcriptional regulator with XRE-family HTH domain